MHKWEALSKIAEAGLVAVVRAVSADSAARIAEACLEGGVSALEITFTVPGAHEVIAALTKRFAQTQVLIGAGSVLDAETARIGILEGARFVVSPSLHNGCAELCHRYQVPYMPGAATPGEVVRALEAGADIVKVFPGETLGPAFVKAVLAPLPHAPLMPTGGVSLQNAADWIRAGSVALGVGGSLTAGAAAGDYAAITNVARQFLARIKEARG
jgi:2-dehydro-3-deoxyphosphogluconate aldolase/(4S)-4-hydroxy-2-oxoglutarate aldolase